MQSHLSAGWRSRVCFPPVSLLCYWARQACQLSRLWCVGRLLTDSLALPCCHRQVTQTPTVCQRKRLQRQWLLPVCVMLVCLTDRLSAVIKLLYLHNVTFVVQSKKNKTIHSFPRKSLSFTGSDLHVRNDKSHKPTWDWRIYFYKEYWCNDWCCVTAKDFKDKQVFYLYLCKEATWFSTF